jgi:uncharacterized protein YgfB (UPF0149 family)
MAVSQLPDFERTLALAGDSFDAGELSECHGVACGLICRRPGSGVDEFLQLLSMLELVSGPDADFRRALGDMHGATKLQLEDEQMRLALWLPPDDDPLEDRTLALTQWCSGFLAGLGGGGNLEALSEEANEALEDLRQVAMAEVSGEGNTEEEEDAFVEIVEYIRIVALLLREDLRSPVHTDRIH